MTETLASPLRRRKRPVQRRSEATVAALLDAGIQVMLAVGYRKLTTTRVAERAGASVGTLYQYFPNRQSLVAAIVERYLDELVASIEADSRTLIGAGLAEMANGLADAFIAAKWKRIAVTRAMHEPLADAGRIELLQASALKGADMLSRLLSTCSDAAWDDVRAVALFVVTASASLLQAAIAGPAQSVDREALRTHLRATVLGYLKEMRQL